MLNDQTIVPQIKHGGPNHTFVNLLNMYYMFNCYLIVVLISNNRFHIHFCLLVQAILFVTLNQDFLTLKTYNFFLIPHICNVDLYNLFYILKLYGITSTFKN